MSLSTFLIFVILDIGESWSHGAHTATRSSTSCSGTPFCAHGRWLLLSRLNPSKHTQRLIYQKVDKRRLTLSAGSTYPEINKRQANSGLRAHSLPPTRPVCRSFLTSFLSREEARHCKVQLLSICSYLSASSLNFQPHHLLANDLIKQSTRRSTRFH